MSTVTLYSHMHVSDSMHGRPHQELGSPRLELNKHAGGIRTASLGPELIGLSAGFTV